MKLNRRSFIQKAAATLAALAAGLRGETADAEVARKAKAIAERTRCEGGGFLVPNDSLDVMLSNRSPRLPHQWGISSSTIADRIRELGDIKWREMSTAERKQFYMDAVLDDAFIRGDAGEPIGILGEKRESRDTLFGHPIVWTDEMHDDCIVDVRQFMIDELENA